MNWWSSTTKEHVWSWDSQIFNTVMQIFFSLLLMRLLMLKTWSGLSKVGESSCSLSFPRGVQNHRPQLACFVAAFRFLLSQIITDVSAVSPDDVCWRRHVGERWHGDTSHPLPLSISSRCSRLMELLIGENAGFLDARFLVDGMYGGSTPALSAAAEIRLTLMCVFHSGGATTMFLFGFFYIFTLYNESKLDIHCKNVYCNTF